jgi:hypothetical protein
MTLNMPASLVLQKPASNFLKPVISVLNGGRLRLRYRLSVHLTSQKCASYNPLSAKWVYSLRAFRLRPISSKGLNSHPSVAQKLP